MALVDDRLACAEEIHGERAAFSGVVEEWPPFVGDLLRLGKIERLKYCSAVAFIESCRMSGFRLGDPNQSGWRPV